MPWFKIDDGFHSHPKVVAAGNEAVGLFIRCGTHCAQHLTDGFVDSEVAKMYGPTRLAVILTRVRLWVPTETGFHIPDYLEYNPSKVQVLEERAKATERKRRSRAGHGVSHGVTSPGLTGVVTPTPHPTRPVSAAAGGGGKISVDQLPDELHVLRARFGEFTALEHVSFAGLTPEQAEEIVTLINKHGDARLLEVARSTKRQAAFVQAFIPTWSALGSLRTVADPNEPKCPLCHKTARACAKANRKLRVEDQCEGQTA